MINKKKKIEHAAKQEETSQNTSSKYLKNCMYAKSISFFFFF